MFDPIALPIARFDASLIAAVAETRISGAEVAKPTTVKPINIVETPKFFAIAAAPRTILSAPHTSNMNPARIESTYNVMGDDYNDRRSNKVIFPQ